MKQDPYGPFIFQPFTGYCDLSLVGVDPPPLAQLSDSPRRRRAVRIMDFFGGCGTQFGPREGDQLPPNSNRFRFLGAETLRAYGLVDWSYRGLICQMRFGLSTAVCPSSWPADSNAPFGRLSFVP